MTKKSQYPGSVNLTLKKARAVAIQEFGTARGLAKDPLLIGLYRMNFANLHIEIRTDADCIVVRVNLAHGAGSSVKYFDPETLQEDFKAIESYCQDKEHAVISDWVNRSGPEYCQKQIDAIWEHGG